MGVHVWDDGDRVAERLVMFSVVTSVEERVPRTLPRSSALHLATLAPREPGCGLHGNALGRVLPGLLLGTHGVALCRWRDESALDRGAGGRRQLQRSQP